MIGGCAKNFCNPRGPAYCSEYKDGMRCTAKRCSPPRDCISFFDGCNVCVADKGQTTKCTEKFCFQKKQPFKKQPFCREFNDGRKCQGLADCSGSDTTTTTTINVPPSCISWHDGESMHTRLIASKAITTSIRGFHPADIYSQIS